MSEEGFFSSATLKALDSNISKLHKLLEEGLDEAEISQLEQDTKEIIDTCRKLQITLSPDPEDIKLLSRAAGSRYHPDKGNVSSEDQKFYARITQYFKSAHKIIHGEYPQAAIEAAAAQLTQEDYRIALRAAEERKAYRVARARAEAQAPAAVPVTKANEDIEAEAQRIAAALREFHDRFGLGLDASPEAVSRKIASFLAEKDAPDARATETWRTHKNEYARQMLTIFARHYKAGDAALFTRVKAILDTTNPEIIDHAKESPLIQEVKPLTLAWTAARWNLKLNAAHVTSGMLIEKASQLQQAWMPSHADKNKASPEVLRGMHECQEMAAQIIARDYALLKEWRAGRLPADTIARAKIYHSLLTPAQSLGESFAQLSQAYLQFENVSLKYLGEATGLSAVARAVAEENAQPMLGDSLIGTWKRPHSTLMGKLVQMAASSAATLFSPSPMVFYKPDFIVERPARFTFDMVKPIMGHFEAAMRRDIRAHFKEAASAQNTPDKTLKVFGEIKSNLWLRDKNGKRVLLMKKGQSLEFLNWSDNGKRRAIFNLFDEKNELIGQGEANTSRRYMKLVPHFYGANLN